MTSFDQAAEIQSLKAQVNALTQLALHAVAVLEMNELVDGLRLQAALLQLNWPEPINQEAHHAMSQYCDLLAAARYQRQLQGKHGENQKH